MTFAPMEVVHVDLADDVPAVPADARAVFAVAWRGDVPLGHLELGPAELGRPAVAARAIAQVIAPAVAARLFPGAYAQQPPSRVPAPPAPPPPVGDLLAQRAPLAALPAPVSSSTADTSVIVCTRGRPDDLARCLEALGQMAAPPLETIVVDNDPADGRTREVVARFSSATYVPEPRPGLSAARNAGIRASGGAVIAFVDDDTAVHARWLERLLAGFDGPRVLAVTGLVLPAELTTRAQIVFEKGMGHSGRGHAPILYDREFFEPQLPFGVPVWAIGAGANMAFRREAFERVGLFDERLGAGAAGCSEDSELWYRLLAAGWECRYQPDSVVLHWHRREMDELRRQAHDYLKGHVAALFVQYAAHRHPGNLRRALLTIPGWLARRALDEALAARPDRTGLLAAELAGYAAGLRLWRLARR
jgi:GT2 family glycosyltransferase